MAKAKPVKALERHKVGHYAFIAGIVVAIIIALIPQIRGQPATVTLIILGLVVGWLNIKAKEITEFLVAALVLLVSVGMTSLILRTVYLTLGDMWENVIVFVAFAAIIVAIKAVYLLAEK